MSTASTSRKSKRIEEGRLPKAKEAKKAVNKRQQWKDDNEKVLADAFDRLIEDLIKYGGEKNVRDEGTHSFQNWAEICADELCPGIARICNDDSTEDEDEVDGLCSEDEEEEPEEDETEEDSDAPEYDETDEEDDDEVLSDE